METRLKHSNTHENPEYLCDKKAMKETIKYVKNDDKLNYIQSVQKKPIQLYIIYY